MFEGEVAVLAVSSPQGRTSLAESAAGGRGSSSPRGARDITPLELG